MNFQEIIFIPTYILTFRESKSQQICYQYMTWESYIHSDPTILAGKPVVRGTRLAVDFIMRLLATGWSESQILENYPTHRNLL